METENNWEDEQWHVDYLDALCSLCSGDEFQKIRPPMRAAKEYFKAQYIGMSTFGQQPTRQTAAEIQILMASRRAILDRRFRAVQIRKIISDPHPDTR